MKKFILTGIYVTLCIPTVLFADVTLTTAEQCLVAWGGANVDTCAVTEQSNTIATGIAYDGFGTRTSGSADSAITGPFSANTTKNYYITCNGLAADGVTPATLTAGPAVCSVPAAAIPVPTTPTVTMSASAGGVNVSTTATFSSPANTTYYNYGAVSPSSTACPASLINQNYLSTTLSGTPTDFGWGPGTYRICAQACNASGCSGSGSATYTVVAPPTVILNFSLLEKAKALFFNLISTVIQHTSNSADIAYNR